MTAAPALLAERVFTIRSIRHTLRSPDALLMAIALPVILMLLFTFVFGGAIAGDGSYVRYVVPGIILLCAGFGAASVAVDVATDMTGGIIDRFRTMPVRASAVLTGHVVASLLRNLLATCIVVGVAIALGFRPTAGPLEWLAAFALVAFWILAITYLFAAIGLASGSAEAANGYGFILLFLPYVSSAFVPTDTMPDWLQVVADNQPLTPLIETLRALLTGAGDADPVAAVLWTGGVLLVAVAWSAWLFPRKAARR